MQLVSPCMAFCPEFGVITNYPVVTNAGIADIDLVLAELTYCVWQALQPCKSVWCATTTPRVLVASLHSDLCTCLPIALHWYTSCHGNFANWVTLSTHLHPCHFPMICLSRQSCLFTVVMQRAISWRHVWSYCASSWMRGLITPCFVIFHHWILSLVTKAPTSLEQESQSL